MLARYRQRVPTSWSYLDELLPDVRVLPALAAALGQTELLLPTPRFYTRWLDTPTDGAVYAAFALD